MTFFPSTLPQDYKYRFTSDFEEVFLKSEDGIINALHFKTEHPKGVILYFHGNSGDLSRWGNVAEDFLIYNYDVFIMDYRTFGKSKGELNEENIYKDAQACYEYVLKDFSENQIIVYGRSIGTGVAAKTASNNNPKHLILETPYHSITDVAKHRFPIFPIKPFLKYQFPTYRFLENVVFPVTIFHGKMDKVIPFSSAQKLYKSQNEDKIDFVIFETGNHNNSSTFPLYREKIREILD